MLFMGLGSRAFAIDLMQRAPGFDARPIISPVVVTGLHRTGAHRYRAEDFGMSESSICEQFGNYVDRFDLHPA